MSDTPPRPGPEGAPAQPFQRGRIQWSRPPQPVFRVGPLPRAAGSAFVAQPVRQPGPGILTGSMIPPARPSQPEPESEVEVVPDSLAEPIEPLAEAIAAVAEAPSAPEPEQIEARPSPESRPAAPREVLVEIEPAEPVETLTPPLSGDAQPAAEPRSMPSVVVTPAIYATVSAAIETVTKKDRWIIVAAVVAVLVTGGFIWLATLPSGGASQIDLAAPPPAADGLTVEVVDPAPAPAAAPVDRGVASPVPSAPAAEAPTRPAARTPDPVRPTAPVTAAPTPQTVAPQPYIETAPLAVEPPTAAQPAPSDADAPIPTQPQPLG